MTKYNVQCIHTFHLLLGVFEIKLRYIAFPHHVQVPSYQGCIPVYLEKLIIQTHTYHVPVCVC